MENAVVVLLGGSMVGPTGGLDRGVRRVGSIGGLDGRLDRGTRPGGSAGGFYWGARWKVRPGDSTGGLGRWVLLVGWMVGLISAQQQWLLFPLLVTKWLQYPKVSKPETLPGSSTGLMQHFFAQTRLVLPAGPSFLAAVIGGVLWYGGSGGIHYLLATDPTDGRSFQRRGRPREVDMRCSQT